MTNTDQNHQFQDELSEEARRARNAQRYRNAENCIAEFLELKARELLDAQRVDPKKTANASREVGAAVLSIQRIKEMNDHDSKPDAADDAESIERKRAAFIRYADAVRAELDRQLAARRDAEGSGKKDSPR
jgi:hypothetical protein